MQLDETVDSHNNVPILPSHHTSDYRKDIFGFSWKNLFYSPHSWDIKHPLFLHPSHRLFLSFGKGTLDYTDESFNFCHCDFSSIVFAPHGTGQREGKNHN